MNDIINRILSSVESKLKKLYMINTNVNSRRKNEIKNICRLTML